MKYFLSLLLAVTICLAFSRAALAATLTSDGSLSDTQSKVNSAVDGDTVALPAGSFTWAGTLTISGKGIKLQGAGAGRVVARSVGANTIGTGTKVFTVNASGLAITAGQTLRVSVPGGERDSSGNGTGQQPWMEGTVTTYSGTTLTMSIGSINYSGTYNLWIVSSNATTTVNHNHASLPLIEVTEDTTHSVEISGFRVMVAAVSPRRIKVNSGGKPVLIHDMWFDELGAGISVEFNSRRGIMWNCSFVCFQFGDAGTQGFNNRDSSFASWTVTSTMGNNDTGGTNNLYVEDCDFHGLVTSFDVDENGRAVVRHCLFNQASMGGSHGPDTSNFGVRHLEIYKNECVFNAIGGSPDLETFNLNKWVLLRGGTGIIASNILPDITSQAWSDKPEIQLACWQLQHNAGPNPCWGANNPGNQYPSPRQIGMGYVTGAGLDGLGRSTDSVTYVGDSEPLYIWGNTGTYVASGSDFGGSECTSPDSVAGYVVAGRDYYNNETAKPSWVPYTYPHPLRMASSPDASTAPAVAISGRVTMSGGVRISR